VEPLALHEKIFVDPAFLQDENHGQIACQDCHGGDPADSDWPTAHAGVVKDPTIRDAKAVCGECHPEIVESSATSLHVTLAPFARMIDARATAEPDVRTEVTAARKAHCGQCHASCGQCHVGRPAYVGGGFLAGHLFQKTPPMREVCTACHGSRVENEYFGKNPGAPPDVHWRKRFMRCVACHGGQEMHGDGRQPMGRYDVRNAPACLDCHKGIMEADAPNAEQHLAHMYRVSCQACHSVAYKNCYNCHFALDRNGFKYFKNERSELGFAIGRNHQLSKDRLQDFVVLRHVPIARDSFSFYVENGLERFDALPTWKEATPHNIQRRTPQNAQCSNCHGSKKFFLTPDRIAAGEAKANAPMAVTPELLPAVVEGKQ